MKFARKHARFFPGRRLVSQEAELRRDPSDHGAWLEDGWLATVNSIKTPNFGERPAGSVVSLIVVHNISLPPGSFGGDWVVDFFLNQLDPDVHPYFAQIAGMQVSAHFYIRRDGYIIQLVGCDQRAWHAGLSCWAGQANCNDYSVGIELEGCDEQAFEAGQYVALYRLIDALRQRYPIAAIVGHSHIAPGRKSDPGPHFDWLALAGRYPDLDLPPEVGAQAADGFGEPIDICGVGEADVRFRSVAAKIEAGRGGDADGFEQVTGQGKAVGGER
jgi:AmpD protein